MSITHVCLKAAASSLFAFCRTELLHSERQARKMIAVKKLEAAESKQGLDVAAFRHT